MKKIILFLLCISALAGCTSETAETTTAAETTTVQTAVSDVTTTTEPSLEVEGLELSFLGGVHVYIPADYTDENIGEYFRETENVIYEPDEDSMFCVVEGALYSKDMTKLYAVPAECEDEATRNLPSPKKAFTVPDSVTWIAPNAFYMITTERPLINLYIHDGVADENVRELVLWGGTFVIREGDMK